MTEIEIGRGKRGREAYGFDDIAIVPSRRTRDPQEVSIAWQIDAYRFELPLLAAPMDSVVSPATAVEIGRLGGVGVLNLEGLWTRYENPEPLLAEIAGLPDDRVTARMQELYAAPIDPDRIAAVVKQVRDAGVTVAGAEGERALPCAQCPAAYMTPAIEPNELVTAVRFPQWPPGHGYAFVEFSRRHGDFAITSAAALLEGDAAGKITRASLTIGGMGTTPSRAREVERAIVGQRPTSELFRDACESCRKLEAIDDVHAPASYRQHLAAVLSRRALEKAHARLTGTDQNRARPH